MQCIYAENSVNTSWKLTKAEAESFEVNKLSNYLSSLPVTVSVAIGNIVVSGFRDQNQ